MIMRHAYQYHKEIINQNHHKKQVTHQLQLLLLFLIHIIIDYCKAFISHYHHTIPISTITSIKKTYIHTVIIPRKKPTNIITMNKTLLTLALLSVSTEAFAPQPLAASKNSQVTKLDANKIGGDIDVGAIAKTAVASILSFSLLFGPTPALADGTFA